jgi:hypothetical protein
MYLYIVDGIGTQSLDLNISWRAKQQMGVTTYLELSR